MIDDITQPRIQKRMPPCSMCCVGCVGVYLFFVVVLFPTVVDPYIKYKARIPTCRSNRDQLLELEKIYKRNNPKHQYTTNFANLRGEAQAHNMNLEMYRCPDSGTYRIVQTGKKLVIYCDISDHLPISQE